MNKMFVLLILLFAAGYAQAQVGLTWSDDFSQTTKSETIDGFSALHPSGSTYAINAFGNFELTNNLAPISSQDLQAPLGIFCNLDLNLDQNLPFKLRFRLGEYHYTQYLEYGIENFLSRSNEIK